MTGFRPLAISMALAILAACGSNKAKPDGSVDGPTPPQCSDGIDNDGDGKIDYPNDPGCLAPNQDDENDDCPSGPHCPQCGDGKDNDGNGKIDYPDDPGCTAASDPEEFTENPDACGQGLTIKMLPANGDDTVTLASGSTSTLIAGACGGGGGALAVAYEIHLAQPAVIVASTDFGTTTADTVLDLRSSASCTDPSAELACSNDIAPGTNTNSKLTANVPAGVYYLIVEGFDSNVTGAYQLHVDLLNGEGVACVDSTHCGPGLVCRIPLGGTQMVCAKPVCSDGVDDDGDGKADYPDDPGCTDPNDNDETDDCPNGPTCPQCANGIDDDGDGLIDYPNDPSCASASSNSEACQGEQDPVTAITMAATNGDLTNAHDDRTPSCQPSSGPDLLYTLTIPALQSLTLDTIGSNLDTVLSLLPPSCQGDLGCNDDGGGNLTSLLTVANLAAGTYLVSVDVYGLVTPGPFVLNVSGTLAPGASCEPADTLNGVFTCATANPCTGAVGSRICQPTACSDGIDNDGDGKIDYPNDPGCTSPDDTDETDDCPNGPTCPQCGNGIDDDGDGQIDYPNDPGCSSAAGTSEACAGEQDPIVAITAATTSGDLTNAHNDQTATCQSNTAGDLVYSITVPQLDSLTLDTIGSMRDTVVSLLAPSCTTSLGCDDDGGGNLTSLLTVNTLAAGTYYVSVDLYVSGTAGPFNLHTAGVIHAGAACTSPLVAAGALTCATGTTCTAGTCQ